MKNTLALVAACLAAFMFALEISSVPVVLPTLERVLHGNFSDMQWVVNAYIIASTTILMAAGTLGDRYGRKRIFIFSLLLFGIASLICGTAQNVAMLILSRALQGLGGGGMLICLLAIMSHQFREGHERSKAFGLWGIIFGAGLGFGPVVGGLIVAIANWRWVFLVHVPLTILTLALVWKCVEESSDSQAHKLDIAGIVTLSLSVFGLVYLVMEGPKLGFASPAGIGIAAAVAAALVLFVRAQRRSSYPMFDFSVFRIRAFSGAILGSIGVNFSFWPLLVYLPTYFEEGLGYGSAATGLILLAYTLPVLVFPPLGERLVLRYQPRLVIPLGLFTVGLGILLMKIGSAGAWASWMTMLPGCLLAGTGVGLANTSCTNTVTGSVPLGRVGMASGMDVTARMTTLATNIAIMGLILLLGVESSLGKGAPTHLRALAERIVAGDLSSSNHIGDISAAAIHAALQHGFGLVMIYGWLGAWALATLSYLAFGRMVASSSSDGYLSTICNDRGATIARAEL
jgi:EmrB/QacA subfamily drug resistance transporter